MCKVNPRRLAPKAADSVNGETLIYNSTTGYWESTPASPFDPTADQAITGTWSFNKPINLKVFGGSPTTPTDGHSIYCAISGQETRLFASGQRHIYDYSAISATRTITVPDASGTLAFLGDNTFTGQTANTAFSGFSLINATAATSGNQQYSPAITQVGRGWTTTTAENKQIGFRTQVVPTSGTAGYWAIDSSVDGALATYVNSFRFKNNQVGTGPLVFGADLTLTEYTGIHTTSEYRIIFKPGSPTFINTGQSIQFSDGYSAHSAITTGHQWIIGGTTASAKLHVVSTTKQLRLGYDVSNYVTYTVSSSGNLTIALTGGGSVTYSGNINSNANITAAGGGAMISDLGFIIASKSRLYSGSDGIFLMRNAAGTDFNLLQFGGTTNAFSAIKRNGTGIDFRLADDSDYTNIAVKAISTDEPGGGTVQPWKLGTKTAITDGALTALGFDSQISIDVNGTVYYLTGKATNPFA